MTPMAPLDPMAPRPPSAPPGSGVKGSTGISMFLVGVALIVVVVIAASTLPTALVAARTAAFPTPKVSIETSTQGPVGTGESVTFTAQRAAGNQLTYTWTFANSDGSPIQNSSGNDLTATGPTTSQSFDNYGSVTATLTATDPTGQSAQANTTVQVYPPAPTAAFIANTSYSFCFVQFDGSGSSSQASITDYFWNFGDGNTDDSYTSSGDYHYYTGAGTYDVTLTVSDSYGQKGTTTQTIHVSC